MQLTFYSAVEIRAEATHTETCHWLDLILTENSRGRSSESEIAICFEGPKGAALVDRIVAAISAVLAEPEADHLKHSHAAE